MPPHDGAVIAGADRGLTSPSATRSSFTNQATGLHTLFAVSHDHGFIYELKQPGPGDWSGGWKQVDAGNAVQQRVQSIATVAQPDGSPLLFAVTGRTVRDRRRRRRLRADRQS